MAVGRRGAAILLHSAAIMRLFLLVISVSLSVGTPGIDESINNWIAEAIGDKGKFDGSSNDLVSKDSNAPCLNKLEQNSGTSNALPPCKAKFDLNPKTTLTETPIGCVTEDKTAGRCVFFYQCAPKTTTVSDNSISLPEKFSMLVARYSKSPCQCPYALQVCCRATDVVETPSVKDIGLPKVKTGPFVPTKNPTDDVKPDCVTNDKFPGRCVLFYKCDFNNKTMIDIGPTILDDIYSVTDKRDSNSKSECPYEYHVCCRLKESTQTPDAATGEVSTEPTENRKIKKPENATPVECRTEDNVPGKCVLFYRCDIKSRNIIDVGPNMLDSVFAVLKKNNSASSSECSYEHQVCCRPKPPSPSPGTSTERVTEDSTEPVPSATTEQTKGTPDECRTEDNVPGKCVLFYRCDLQTKTILDIGPNMLDSIYAVLKKIDVSSPYQCSYEHQVCCKPKAPTPTPGTSTERVTEVSTEPVPSATTEQTTAPQPCTRRTGEAGVCVRFSQCRSSDRSVITDGVGLIDVRFASSRCPSKYICCLLPDTITPSPITPSTIKPSTVKPSTIKPSTIKPSTIKPSTIKPSTIKPSTIKPSTIKPYPTSPTPIPVQPTGCGQRRRDGVKSVKGNSDRDANFGEFPWMCAIMQFTFIRKYQSESQVPRPGGFLGGGSLIHPKAVIAAAHNVAGKRGLLVRAGEWDLHNTNEPYPVQERNVKKVIVHEGFKNYSLHYDIAVLVLEKPMDLMAHIGVVCLPPPRARLPGGTRCVTSGWGTDKYGKGSRYNLMLKKLDLPVVDHTTCQDIIRSRKFGYFYNLHSSVMCAGGESDDMDACVGDGGSPLVCRIPGKPDRYTQRGIVSWGIDCASKGIPGVYVDVSSVREWIDKKVISEGLDPKVYTV